MDKEKVVEDKERLEPSSITVATTTFYKNWYPGEVKDNKDAFKIRGDLFIDFAKEVQSKGFGLVVVDGGSSNEFLKEMEKMRVKIIAQEEKGMSASRRQVFEEASNLSTTKVIAWTEPEKISIVRDCLPKAAEPILRGEADIVIPKRDEEAFKTYPEYQVKFEKKANLLWNKLLRSQGLLPVDQELDVWFGPRFFSNKPEVTRLFQRVYGFKESGIDLHRKVDPEKWANATFLPIVAALKEKLRVVSIDVAYRHPKGQSDSEVDSEEFRQRRELQLVGIVDTTLQYLRLVSKDQNTRAKSKLFLME